MASMSARKVSHGTVVLIYSSGLPLASKRIEPAALISKKPVSPMARRPRRLLPLPDAVDELGLSPGPANG